MKLISTDFGRNGYKEPTNKLGHLMVGKILGVQITGILYYVYIRTLQYIK